MMVSGKTQDSCRQLDSSHVVINIMFVFNKLHIPEAEQGIR